MRINHVTKARKAQGECGACGKEVAAGTAYKWVKARYGPKRVRHEDCPTWKASELTSSDKLAAAYGAQEDIYEAIANWAPDPNEPDASDIVEALEAAASTIRDEVAEGYRESASNIEDGFGHSTSQSEELEGKADEADTWADEVEQAASDMDEPPDKEDVADDDWQEAVTTWADDVKQAAEEAANACPF